MAGLRAVSLLMTVQHVPTGDRRRVVRLSACGVHRLRHVLGSRQSGYDGPKTGARQRAFRCASVSSAAPTRPVITVTRIEKAEHRHQPAAEIGAAAASTPCSTLFAIRRQSTAFVLRALRGGDRLHARGDQREVLALKPPRRERSRPGGKRALLGIVEVSSDLRHNPARNWRYHAPREELVRALRRRIREPSMAAPRPGLSICCGSSTRTRATQQRSRRRVGRQRNALTGPDELRHGPDPA